MADITGQMTAEERKLWALKKEETKFRRARRKVRESQGEVDELNITAMMDMMTILLVFLLKSYSASTVSVAISSDLTPPTSTAHIDPQETASVTITTSDIAVGDKAVVPLDNGAVRAQDTDPVRPVIITPLLQALKKEVDKQKTIEKWNAQAREEAKQGRRLTVIGDKNTPYKVLFSVLATAGLAELSNYKFIVLKPG